MHNLSVHPLVSRLSLLALALGAGLSLQGQAVHFTHFHAYPPGQYRQETRATMTGKPIGEPVISTSCASPLSPQRSEAIKNLEALAGGRNDCTVKILADTPATAEYVQTCNVGPIASVSHFTMHAVDDRTMTVDTQMSMGGRPTVASHGTSTYLGACPAGMAAAQAEKSKPSKAECADIAQMKQQQEKQPANACADAPAAYKSQCEAAMKTMKQQTQMLEAACR